MISRKGLLAMIFVLLLPLAGSAQYRTADTLSFPQKIDKFSSTRFYQMTYIGVPLIISGLVVKGQDDHFRSLRNDYLPYFNRHADDYMPYIPVAAMLGMKTFGVEGRSSWGRMLVSDGFSVCLESIVVRSIKHITNVEWPERYPVGRSLL